jgi:DNA-binding CsgD family transcriptional regulator/PAS domain-containing protein
VLNESVLTEILDVLYEAPVDPTRWQDFLKLTAQAVGGEAGALTLHDFTDVQSLVSRQWNIDPDALRRYEAHYSKLDVWFQSVRHAKDWLGTSEHFVDFATLQKTEFYNDLVLPSGIPHAMFGMVERTPTRVANIGIYRGLRAGSFDQRDLEPIRFLSPHIKRAYRLHTQFAAARSENAGLHAALDSVTIGVILIGQDLRIVTMNRAAERLIAQNDGLLATRNGLRTSEAEESAHLQRLVTEASLTSAGKGFKSGGVMNVSRSDRPSLHLMVSPVRGIEVDWNKLVRAIVFATDPTERVRPMQETMQILFGLTPAECRLAALMTDGRSPTEIAQMLKLSRNTLKSQLASIYGKTATSRQSQLVRLLLQISVDPRG